MTKLEKDQYRKCIEESHGMCHICQRPGEQVHHVFGGANRDKSTQYGLLVYLCADCHENVHKYSDLRKTLRKEARIKFMNENPTLDFMKVFGRYE